MNDHASATTLPFESWFAVDAPVEQPELFRIRRTCQFNLLAPTVDGVGPYHINTHKIFFRLPTPRTPAQLTADLYRQFPQIFTPNNLAAVVSTNCRQGGHPTFKFTIDMPGPDLHDDWVRVEWHQTSFLAKTLERLWTENWELAARAGSIAVGPVTTAFGQIGLAVNRKHFLAGRRSWHVGQTTDGLYFLETAAFERYSDVAYQLAETPAGIPAKIVEIWSILLENFVRHIGATPIVNRPSGYRQNRSVYWNRAQSANAAQLRNTPWFQALSGRHTGL